MKLQRSCLLLAIIISILIPSIVSSQFSWTNNPGNPTFTDGLRVLDPCILYDSARDQFDMWYTDGYTIKRGVSLDGISWTKTGSSQSLTDLFAAQFSYGTEVITIGTTYHLYCSYQNPDGITGYIGHATSPDGNTWTRHPSSPALTTGPIGSWEGTYVFYPKIVLHNGVCYMFYQGKATAAAVGLATSVDGATWVKYGGNPIIRPQDLGGDATDVGAAGATVADGVFYLIANKYNASNDQATFNLATSVDGISWTFFSGNPVLTRGTTGSWNDGDLGGGTLRHVQGRYRFWYNATEAGSDTWTMGEAWSNDVFSCLAYYPFNGDANDESGNARNCTVYGATLTSNRFGSPNSAFAFNGVDQYIKGSGVGLPSAERSVSLWFKANTVATKPVLLSYGGSVCGTSWAEGLNHRDDGKAYTVTSHCGVRELEISGSAPTGTWHHWVVTTQSSGTRMYVDGILIGSNTVFFDNTYTAQGDLAFGCFVGHDGTAPYISGNTGEYFLNGALDDIRIYGRALSPAEVQNLYHESGWPYIPKITSVTPGSATVGSSVTIAGEAFSENPTDNSVFFGAVRAHVAGSTPYALAVTVPPGATFAPVTASVGRHSSFSSEPFSPTFEGHGILNSFSFTSKNDFPASGQLVRGTIADLDGDGKPDIAVANAFENKVSIYRNVSTLGVINSTSFTGSLNVPVGTLPYQVISADFNSDGKLDLAAVNNTTQTLSILVNESTPGALNFSRVDYVTPASPYSLAAGDLDGDGNVDLVVSSSTGTSLSLFRNTTVPGEAISFAGKVDIGTGYRYYEVAVTDIDGDAKPDLVAARASGTEQTGSLALFRNTSSTGNINFAGAVQYAIGRAPRGLATGDLDSDGKQDVVVTTGLLAGLSKAISLFRNTSSVGTISLASRLDYSNGTDTASSSVKLADIDGDGKLDMAATLSWTTNDHVGVYHNNSVPGSLAFSPKVNFPCSQDPAGMLVGDLDLDGKPDIVVSRYATSGISVLRNTCPFRVVNGVSLAVADNGGHSSTLYFGFSPGASDGIDGMIGEAELPPVPPVGIFDVRFVLPTTPGTTSLSDCRSDTFTTAQWRLTFQPGTGGYPITLHWSRPGGLSGGLRLQDELGGVIVDVDMTVDTAYVLANTGISSLRILYGKAVTKTVAVNADWNMLSVPLEASDMTPGKLFPGASSLTYGYNNAYFSAQSLTPGKGYWLKFPAGTEYNVTGSTEALKETPLVAGWQMVGPLETNVSVSSLVTVPAGILQGSFYGFASGYHTSTVLEVGKGYWVKASQAGILKFAGASSKVVASETPIPEITVRVEDAKGEARLLYLAKPNESALADELPPQPPSGILDVRFSGNTNTESVERASHTLRLSSAAYPVKVTASGVNGKVHLRLKDALGGTLVNTNLEDRKTVTITQKITELILEGRDIPTEYTLSQNYPNPFNPSTKIEFGLPEASQTKLTVYDILGREVSVLKDEVLEAGYYTVEFSGTSVATGLYFYRLEAGKFSSLKKMLFVK